MPLRACSTPNPSGQSHRETLWRRSRKQRECAKMSQRGERKVPSPHQGQTARPMFARESPLRLLAVYLTQDERRTREQHSTPRLYFRSQVLLQNSRNVGMAIPRVNTHRRTSQNTDSHQTMCYGLQTGYRHTPCPMPECVCMIADYYIP